VQAIPMIGEQAYPAPGTAGLISGFGRQAAGGTPDGNLYSVGTAVADPTSCGVGDATALIDCISSATGSACEGDSGGPLVVNGVLAGVASFVSQGGPTGECGVGSTNGYTNLAAPEIQEFVKGNDAPPLAPRGGSGVSASVPRLAVGTMTCDPGPWTNAPSFSFAFIDTRDGEVLQNGPSSSYALKPTDAGRTLACQVTASNAGGIGVTRTTASSPIGAAPVAPKPNLRLGVSASKKRVKKGKAVTYAIRVLNRGNLSASRVTVCDTPGKGLGFGKLPKGVKKSHGRACWKARSLSARDGMTVKIALTVSRAAKAGKTVKNTVTVRSSNGGTKKGSVTVKVVKR
jgi:uncharacterized repeat protein (TIGR01451 family)